jgi:hypothetical protein
MATDYNFEANYWSSATANHPELIHSYAATILDSQLVPLVINILVIHPIS